VLSIPLIAAINSKQKRDDAITHRESIQPEMGRKKKLKASKLL
jgi:hypothetical protein